MTMNYIDGELFKHFIECYATLIWWKHQQKEENTNNENLHENKDFVEKFIELFEKRLVEIPKN